MDDYVEKSWPRYLLPGNFRLSGNVLQETSYRIREAKGSSHDDRNRAGIDRSRHLPEPTWAPGSGSTGAEPRSSTRAVGPVRLTVTRVSRQAVAVTVAVCLAAATVIGPSVAASGQAVEPGYPVDSRTIWVWTVTDRQPNGVPWAVSAQQVSAEHGAAPLAAMFRR